MELLIGRCFSRGSGFWVFAFAFVRVYCWLLLFAERERAREEQLQSKLEKESVSNATICTQAAAPPVVPFLPLSALLSNIESIPN